MSLYHNDNYNQIPTKARKVYDVSGAGDTVISVAALCLSQNTSIELLGFISNLAGGIVCEYSGVVKLEKEKLYIHMVKKLKILINLRL